MPPQDASRPTAAPRSQPKRTSHIALLISDHRKHSVLWNRWMYIAPYANRSAVARPRAIPIGESTLAWDTSPTSFLQPDGKLPTAFGATDRCRQERAWHRPTRHNTSHAMRRLVSSIADVPGNHLDMKPKQEFQVPPIAPRCPVLRVIPLVTFCNPRSELGERRAEGPSGTVNRKAWSDVPEFVHRFVWGGSCLVNR